MSPLKTIAFAFALGAIAPLMSGQLQTVRNTTPPNPPNPAAYLIDPAGGPMIGETWTPLLDDTVLTPPPAAPAFWMLGVSGTPSSIDIPFGSTFILVSVLPPNPLLTVGPIPAGSAAVPVPIPVPAACDMIATAFSTQSALIDATGKISFTNAIDIVIGGGPRGLYSMSAEEPRLVRVDPTTGATLTSVTIDLPGTALSWGNGLAKQPVTGRLYGVLKWSGGPTPPGSTARPQLGKKHNQFASSAPGPPTGRLLVTICPLTGDATLIGDLGDAFAAIAFDGNTGTLYGVTGDGGLSPDSLYIINPYDATTFFVTFLGNGFDGEMLGFNSADGLLYHGSGNYFYTGIDSVLETVDPVNPTAVPVDIPLAGSLLSGDETNAISAFNAGVGGFYWGSGCCSILGGLTGYLSELYIATPSGVGTYVGPLDHYTKGLATLP